MQVGGRRHNTDDIIATVLAVEPMKFIYRGRSESAFGVITFSTGVFIYSSNMFRSHVKTLLNLHLNFIHFFTN